MIVDATFWVAISFFIFLGILFYFKIPQKISNSLSENINTIKSEVNNAENLKEESNNILSEYEKKISNSSINKDFKWRMNVWLYTGKMLRF